jgi:CRP-like cAMP-binding protein
MKRRSCRAGEVLFRKDEVAHDLHFIVSGTFRVTEIGMTLSPGRFVGELGLLAPGGRRTQSLECVADGELLSITYEHVKELYFQNPDFGFHFLQVTTSRLFQNLEVLQAQLVALQEANSAARDADGKADPRRPLRDAADPRFGE